MVGLGYTLSILGSSRDIPKAEFGPFDASPVRNYVSSLLVRSYAMLGMGKEGKEREG